LYERIGKRKTGKKKSYERTRPEREQDECTKLQRMAVNGSLASVLHRELRERESQENKEKGNLQVNFKSQSFSL